MIQKKFRVLKRTKKFYRERIWKMLQKNILDGIMDLRVERYCQLQQITETQNSNLRHKLMIHNFVLDNQLVSQIIEDFTEASREKWMGYVKNIVLQKDQKKRLREMALQIKLPKLYEIPNEDELKEMIKKYGEIKKII